MVYKLTGTHLEKLVKAIKKKEGRYADEELGHLKASLASTNYIEIAAMLKHYGIVDWELFKEKKTREVV